MQFLHSIANWFADVNNLTALSTSVIAAFTVVLAFVGGRQAFLTRKIIELARDEYTATHRPRIKVRNVSGPRRGERGGDVFRVIAANAGESPAIIIQYKVEAFDHDGEAATEIRLKPSEPVSQIKLASGEAYIFESELEDDWTEGVDDPGRDGPVFVVGAITYKDESGITRHTGFAREVIRGGSFDFNKVYAEEEYAD